MRMTNSSSTRGAPRDTTRMGVPPPRRDLLDADGMLGWIDDVTIGFGGFRNESEAVRAASIACRAMKRRLAGGGDRLPLSYDVEPMSLRRNANVELILAGGRPIATLVRPGADSRSGPEAFGFSLPFPVPSDEVARRATAYLVYLELRRSGIWGTTMAAASSAMGAASHIRASEQEPVTGAPHGEDARRGAVRHVAKRRPGIASNLVATVLVGFAMVVAVLLPFITTSIVVTVLGGAALAVFFGTALVALASLLRPVAMVVRDAFRRRFVRHGRRTRRARIDSSHALQGSRTMDIQWGTRAGVRPVPEHDVAIRSVS